MDILTEPEPASPRPVAHPGAYLAGMIRADRATEYGGPAATPQGGIVAFTPQARPGHGGRPGEDIAPPDLPSIIGRAPAIGVLTRP